MSRKSSSWSKRPRFENRNTNIEQTFIGPGTYNDIESFRKLKQKPCAVSYKNASYIKN